MILKRAGLFILCFLPVQAWAGFWDNAWLDPALMETQDLNGGTGFIHVPAPQSLPDGLVTGGVHGFVVQAGSGFADGIEAGGSVQLVAWDPQTQGETDEWNIANDGVQGAPLTAGKENLLYARWSPLEQGPRCPIGLSFGCEGVGLQNLDPKQQPLASLADQERQYVVAGGILPELPMFYAAVGYGGGDQQAIGSGSSSGFGALAFAPFAGMMAMAEYNDGYTDVGVRVLLSTQIKLDLDVSRLQTISTNQPFDNVLTDNVSFGVSYSQAWP